MASTLASVLLAGKKVDQELDNLFRAAVVTPTVPEPAAETLSVVRETPAELETSTTIAATTAAEVVNTTAVTNNTTTEGKQSRREVLHEKIKQNRRNLFVGNLPLTVTERAGTKALKRLFAAYGQLESIRFRSIAFDKKLPRKQAFISKSFHAGRESLNAYVCFKEEKDAQSALVLNGTVFMDRHIRVDVTERTPVVTAAVAVGKPSSSSGEKAQGESEAASSPSAAVIEPSATVRTVSAVKHDVRNTVFVGNVAFNADEEMLWRHFGQCGDVKNVRIIRDRKTNFGKGFAYVSFVDRACVGLALKLNGAELEGRKLRVTRCDQELSNGRSNAPGKVMEGARATSRDHLKARTPHAIGKGKNSKTTRIRTRKQPHDKSRAGSKSSSAAPRPMNERQVAKKLAKYSKKA